MKNKFMIGFAYIDKEFFILFGYRYFSIWLVKKERRKHYGFYQTSCPDIDQCLFELNPERFEIKNFIGYIK